MKAFRIALIPALAIGIAACSSSNVHQPSPLPVNPGLLKVHRDWSVSVGGGGGDQLLGLAPDVQDGLVVAASAGGDVVAVDSNTGKVKWRHHVRAHLSGGPAIGDGTVAVGSRSGQVYALDASTGKLRWKQYVGSPVIVSPAVADGMVVVNTLAGDVVGLDAKTGNSQWKQNEQAPSLSLRVATQPLIANGVAYAGFADGTAMAINASSGKQLWRKRIAAGQGGNLVADMVDVGRQMAFASGDIYIATYQGKLAAVAGSGGQIIWDRDLSSYTGVTLDGVHLYASDAQGRVHAFDLITGVPVWTNDKLAYRGLSAPVSYHHMVAVGDHAGYLHFLDRNTGRYLGRIDVDDGALRMTPLVVGDKLVVLGAGGDLVAYQVSSKKSH